MTTAPSQLVGKRVVYKCLNVRREGIVTARDRNFVYIKFDDAVEPRAVSSKFVFIKRSKAEAQDDRTSTEDRIV